MSIDWQALGAALSSHTTLVLGVTLGLLYALEAVRPMRDSTADALRLRHLGLNLALWIIGLVLAQLFIEPLLRLSAKLFAPDWGIAALKWPGIVELALGVLLFDLFAYFDHRISHHFRPLWALHVVHHSDPHVDASTAIRAHPGEAIVSVLLSFSFLALLGIPLWVYFIRSALMTPLALFHHANLSMPRSWDRAMRLVIVSPRMHLLHHSPHEHYTNSNYSHMFSIWDRLFGTYRDPDAVDALQRHEFGLAALSAPAHQSFWGALKSPLVAFQRDRL